MKILKNRHILIITMFFVFLLSQHLQAFAAVSSLPDGLNVSVQYAKHNDDTWGIVWLDISKEYYTYAPSDVEDDSILPAQLSTYNKLGEALLVKYPLGTPRADFYNKSKIIQSYSQKTPIFINLKNISNGETVEGKLSLLLCSKQHCLPVKVQISFEIPLELPMLTEQDYFSIWQKSVEYMPVNNQDLASSNSLGLSSLSLGTEPSENFTWAFAPQVFSKDLEVTSINKALLLGFLAGIILNLMPCVFPVLALKASSFLAARHKVEGDNYKEFRMQNLLFAAGMLTLFVILAIFLGTAGFIWGQFYQSTKFVAFMLVLIFLLALSMFGLFNLPMIDLKANSTKSPYMQAYLTGMLTTILATPCSGPLLGGVLSWAFTQNLTTIIIIFVAVGLGMSLPYLILAIKPRWAKLLPRPGAWMLVIERMVGFFLLATSLYLLTILPQEVHVSMLAGLIFVAFAGFIWGNYAGLNAPRFRRIILGFGFIGVILLVILYGAEQSPHRANWHNFDAATFEADLGKKPMLVEFTADWCPNCKFIEKTVLTQSYLAEIQEKYKVKLIKVDITRNNVQGEALLQALGSSSIPLTAIFTTGLQSSAPIVLRDIYTKEMLNEALEDAF